MYRPRARLIVRTFKGINYLVPIGGDWTQSPELIELNEVSTLIVRRLPASLDDTTRAITSECDIDPETAQRDASDFLKDLIALGLVEKATGE